MGLKDIVTGILTIGGWCMSLGIYIAKIKQHDKEIAEIKEEQKVDRSLFQSINNNLTELNTKVTLLLEGKIVDEQKS